jgi:hypothetical protein
MASSPTARDEELFVTCKSCGFPIATGLRRRASELEAPRVEPRGHRCPRCGAAHVYEAADYAHRA